MERLKKLHHGNDDSLKCIVAPRLHTDDEIDREQIREHREPQSSTLLSYNGRVKNRSPLGFHPNDLSYKSHTPMEHQHDPRYQTDRKRDQSRNMTAVGSFKKVAVKMPPQNDQQPQLEIKDIPKLKLPSSGCHPQVPLVGLGTYARPFGTDRQPAYNSRPVPNTPIREKKSQFTERRSRSPEGKNKLKLPDAKFFQEREHHQLSLAQELKQTLSTLSTNVYAPLKHTTSLTTSCKRPYKMSIDNFEFVRQLGVGKSSTVFMVRDKKTGAMASLKCIKKEHVHRENMLGQLIREVKIGSFCRHPNIITLYGIFDDSESFYLLSELGCDGQLYNKLKRVGNFSEEATAFIVRQVLEAVTYLHEHSIYHRDIKPENIVLSHGIVKLCDFGWSVNAEGKELRDTVCGTPLYASPEILQGRRYDQKIDLWAVGMLAYELYFGSIPFDIKIQRDLIRIVTDDVKFPVNHHASPEFKDFIQSVLRKNPCDRLSGEELLKHPYIMRYKGFETCEEICSA